MSVHEQLTAISLRFVVELTRALRSASLAELGTVEQLAEELAASYPNSAVSPALTSTKADSLGATAGEVPPHLARHLSGANGVQLLERLPANREQWIAFINQVYGVPTTQDLPVTVRRIAPHTRNHERILEAFRANPHADVAKVAAKVGLSSSSVYRVLQRAGAGKRGGRSASANVSTQRVRPAAG